MLFRDLEELKELSRGRMFGRPGHGAPTTDIRFGYNIVIL